MFEFKVEGMTCHSCANSISQAMKYADQASSVKVDIKGQTVLISSSKSEKEIASILEEVGFPVLESKKVS